jgi:hypothetical protein
MMRIKLLFERKSRAVELAAPQPPKLPLEALDQCVGGRLETEGVGCYVRTDAPPSH